MAGLLPIASSCCDPCDNHSLVSINLADLIAQQLDTVNVLALDSTTARALDVRFAEIKNVKDYGAIGDGVADDAPAIQRALDSAKRLGVRRVRIPSGTYRLNSMLQVWSGLVLEGSHNPILRRNHFLTGDLGTGTYTGSRFTIELYGGAAITDLVIDGGSSIANVSVWSPSDINGVMNAFGIVNQTQYGDVAVFCGAFDYGPDGTTVLTGADAAGLSGTLKTVIQRNTFLDSCGSSIKTGEGGSRSVIVFQNKFGNYYDHSVYFGGWPSLLGVNTPALDCLIVGNIFSAPTATRGNGCIKVRNYSSRIIIADNTADLPIDTFCQIDAGDSGGSARTGPVVIANNTGTVSRAFGSECSNLAEAIDLTIIGNKLDVITYAFHGSFNATGGPSGRIYCAGNTFRSTVASTTISNILRGNTGNLNTRPMQWILHGNVWDGVFNTLLFGWVEITFTDNDICNRQTPSALINPSFFSPIANNALAASTDSVWILRDNRIWNYATLWTDDSDISTSGGRHTLECASLLIEQNLITGHPTRNWLLDYRGAAAGAYAGPNFILVKGNCTALTTFVSTSTTVPVSKQLVLENITTEGVNMGSRAIVTNGPVGTSRGIFGQTSGLNRWFVGVGAIPETGSDAGSEYRIAYYNDAGAGLGDLLTLTRQRLATLNVASLSLINSLGDTAVTVGTSVTPSTSMTFRGTSRRLSFQTGVLDRFHIRIDETETGSDAGSNLRLLRYNDAGVFIDTPLMIRRSTGMIEITQGIDGAEIADPPAPSANRGVLYFRDNGAGKTQLAVRFPTGVVQVIATEP